MPQNPIPGRGIVGHLNSTLNMTGPTVIKPAPGILGSVILNGVVGTGGSYVFNDCTTVAAASAANLVQSIPGTAAITGLPIKLDVRFKVGIVMSAVATGGTPQVSVSWT